MLAGQPQDPPWQSSEQDQARPSWQAFGAPPAEKQETYAYPQSAPGAPGAPGAQGAQGAQNAQSPQGYGQAYAQQGSYAPPAYTVQDQAYGAQDRPYADQAYGDQAYQEQQGQQGQSAPHWQAVSGLKQAGAGAKRSSDAKGFFGALFDFSFTSFVTPKIVKVIYVLVTIWTVIWALIFLRFGFKYGGAAGGFFTLLVVDPILVVLTLGAYRMVLELFMVVHRMHEELKAIRQRGES
ncbi:MAG TPA: DUF4282 domain-containing protein [Trebonia sp.]|nr:DUF4282 domain-containing protein [Trebonia sp.]